MSMFKLNDVLSCLISWGVASLIWGLKGDGFMTEGAQTPTLILFTSLLRFTLDSGGTRIILIIGFCFLGVERRHQEITRWKEKFKLNGWQLAKMKKSIPDMSLP